MAIHYAAAHLQGKMEDFEQLVAKREVVVTRECRHGTMCYCPHDYYIGRGLELYGEYSEGEVDLFKALLKPDMCVIEVGSNIGALTLPLAKIVGPGGRVLAFEPQRIIFQQMCATLAMNAIWNVFAANVAIGDHQGVIGVPPVDYMSPVNFGGVALVERSPEMVGLAKLDDMPDVDPHFIKIDVEGMELAVLKGADQMIRSKRPVLYVENDRKEKADDLIKHIRELRYDMYWHLPPLFNANNFRGNADNVFGDIVSINMLCIPSELAMTVDGLQRVGTGQ